MPDTTGIETVIREAAPAALGVLLRRGERLAEAEDAVQDALVLAVESWPTGGLPDRPVGWLVRVAQRRLIDHHRSNSARRRREALAASWSREVGEPLTNDDDSLAVLFMCCHPALSAAAAIPLTLRAVGGLTTSEIAEVLLQSEATIGQRISRAKATIAQSGEPFRLPDPDVLDHRLASVMQVIYLIFTEGHTAASGPHLGRVDLSAEGIRLARLLHQRLPNNPETAGLLALLLLSEARRSARTNGDGELVPLDQQDRTLWNRTMITEGLTLLTAALQQHSIGDYQLQAAITAVHDQAPTYAATDWSKLRTLYDLLAHRSDNPVVRLNRAVAVAHTHSPEAALLEMSDLADVLADHHRYHATVGYLEELSGDREDALVAYQRAADLATNEPERRYLQRKAAGFK